MPRSFLVLALGAMCGLLAAFVAGCGGGEQEAGAGTSESAAEPVAGEEVVWPTEGWPTATPEAEGLRSEALSEALAYIDEHGLDVHSLLIVRHGHVLLDAPVWPSSGIEPHDLASVTKSVTATLVGVAIEQGFLSGLDQTLGQLFDDRDLAPEAAAITLGDLLSMRSGLDCARAPSVEELVLLRPDEDWVQLTLDLPVIADPGSEFFYCSLGMHVVSAALAAATDMTTDEFARQYLFEPLGIDEWVWPADSRGVNHGWGDLQLKPPDAAKLGFLYLQDGSWEGERILPEGWAEEATSPLVEVSAGSEFYGYGWWVLAEPSPGVFEARGRGGQEVIVWPTGEIVVVSSGAGFDLAELTPLLLAAVVGDEPLPPNPAAEADLQRVIDTLAQPPEAQTVPTLPDAAQMVSGRTYRLDENALGLDQLSLQFDETDASILMLGLPGETVTLPIGLDGVPRVAPGRGGRPVATQGRWEDDKTFLVEYEEVDGPNHVFFHITFAGETIVVELDDPTGLFANETITGTNRH